MLFPFAIAVAVLLAIAVAGTALATRLHPHPHMPTGELQDYYPPVWGGAQNWFGNLVVFILVTLVVVAIGLILVLMRM